MTVVSVKTGADPNLVKTGFSDGSLFYISLHYLDHSLQPLLQPGTELDDAAMEHMLYAASCYRAERAALNLIARTEQHYQGLLQKLLVRGHDREQSCIVLQRLCSLDLVNDERYAEYWLEARLRRGNQGPRKLSAALQSKGIDRGCSDRVLKRLLPPEKEYEILLRYIAKKRIPVRSCDFLEIRQMLYIAGFTKSAIRLYFEYEGL